LPLTLPGKSRELKHPPVSPSIQKGRTTGTLSAGTKPHDRICETELR
jgi:hypothetical protein